MSTINQQHVRDGVVLSLLLKTPLQMTTKVRKLVHISILVVSLLLYLVFPNVAPVHAVTAGCADNSAASIIDAPSSLPRVGCGNDKSYVETIFKLVAGALAMFSLLFIVIGGARYALSGGDSNAIASAKKTILYAVIGLVLGLSTFTIVSFVFTLVNG